MESGHPPAMLPLVSTARPADVPPTCVPPTQTTVGAYKYRLIFSTPLIQAAADEMGDSQCGLIGYCEPRDQTIVIREGMGDDITRDTVLHEHLHAMLHQAFPHLEVEEEVVRTMTFQVLNWMRANPSLLEYLLA